MLTADPSPSPVDGVNVLRKVKHCKIRYSRACSALLCLQAKALSFEQQRHFVQQQLRQQLTDIASCIHDSLIQVWASVNNDYAEL
jgi:hypothetical protein